MARNLNVSWGQSMMNMPIVSIIYKFIINSFFFKRTNNLALLLFLKSISIISRGGPQPARSPWRYPRVQRRRSRWRGREFPRSRRQGRQKCNRKPKDWIMTQEQILSLINQIKWYTFYLPFYADCNWTVVHEKSKHPHAILNLDGMLSWIHIGNKSLTCLSATLYSWKEHG